MTNRTEMQVMMMRIEEDGDWTVHLKSESKIQLTVEAHRIVFLLVQVQFSYCVSMSFTVKMCP